MLVCVNDKTYTFNYIVKNFFKKVFLTSSCCIWFEEKLTEKC